MLEFKLGSYPIRVHWSYLLLIILVLNARFGIIGIVIWLTVAFVSILLHELGHAYMVRRKRAILNHIMLYGLGGVTVWTDQYGSSVSWKDRIWISAAGPMTGIASGLVAFAAIRFGLLGEAMQTVVTVPWRVALSLWAAQGAWLSFAVASLVWVGLMWGLVNLLPIGGLDGSHILAEILERRNPRDGRKTAAWVGIVVAGAAAVYAVVVWRTWFLAFVFAMFALNDYARVNDQPPPFGNIRS